MPETPMRVAFVGAGAMASLHLKALRRVRAPHTVVGVCDVNPDRANAFASRADAIAYPDVPTLLAVARPDLVHVCTPAGSHFEPARQALAAEAHVYVEKPFVGTREEAETLFQIAARRARLICAGHQLLYDRAFARASRRVPELMPVTLIDSLFAFQPPQLRLHGASPRALAGQLLDVLPHPLYTLVAALEQCATRPASLELVSANATPTELHVLLRVGDVIGRLVVSLRARPVASTLTWMGARGSLTTDFMRSIVLGVGNEGTTPLEKIANPLIEGFRQASRSAASVARRLLHGGDYPGLAELLGAFYAVAAANTSSPLSVDHLRRVTALYEALAEHVYRSVPTAALAPRNGPRQDAPIAVLTGAAGFFGAAIARDLARRGFRVRGVGRSERPDDANVHEWVRADLAAHVVPEVLADADVVVHAAAETHGSFDAHARNTVAVTRNLLDAMRQHGIRRLVYISTISVLRPPTSPWEVQTESTPMPEHAEPLGAYTWGKCRAEALVAHAEARGQIDARIVRPGALIDWEHLEFPGLLGRRLFGKWYMACGRPGLPFAVCDVRRAGEVVAWCAERFEEAPAVVNLFEPTIATRRRLVELFRKRGFRGRMIWVPISLLSSAVLLARTALALAQLRAPQRLRVFAVLRHRRYDPRLSNAVLAAAWAARRGPVATADAEVLVRDHA